MAFPAPELERVIFNSGNANADASISAANAVSYIWGAQVDGFPAGGRGIVIGFRAARSPTTFYSNSCVIGNEAARFAATLATAVVIGDTAAGQSLTVSNSNVIGNEAGNGPSIASSNIIGNAAQVGGLNATALRVDVMGMSGLRYNAATDTVAIGWNAGVGTPGNVGAINQSVLIGAGVGGNYVGATVSNVILIGYNIDAPSADTSNYISIANVFLGSTATADYTIQKPDGGNANLNVATLKLTNLPTTDPVSAGAVWNDAGTLKISAG